MRPPSVAGRQPSTLPEGQPAFNSNASSNVTIRPQNGDGAGEDAQGEEVDDEQSTSSSRAGSSTLYIAILTLSLLGAQMAWSLELSYGTPYLLSLGLSPQTTSLVWLAGPVSGLVAQPVVGHLSDQATNVKWRRRAYMLASSAFIIAAAFALAFAEPFAELLVDFLGIGLADWDPVRNDAAQNATRAVAIGAFWVLDFALNGLQASARALILDRLDAKDVDRGNAWQGRMTHLGNILGYSAGYLDLSSLRVLRPLGGDQFRKFAIIALTGLIVSVGLTTIFIGEGSEEEEEDRRQLQTSTFSSSALPKHTGEERDRWPLLKACRTSVSSIWHALLRLPRPIRRVCLVQVFAFMGWFPFLFYATTWIGTFEPRGTSQALQEGRERKGTEGMLLFAILSLVGGSLLPTLALANGRNPKSALSKYHAWVSGQPRLRRLGQGVSLRTYWTMSCLMQSLLLLFCTFLAASTSQAILLVGLVGLPWSIAAWAPFSLVMSFVREAEEGRSPYEFASDYWSDDSRRRRQSMSSMSNPEQQSRGRHATQEALLNCGPLQGDGQGDDGATTPTPRITSGSFVARGNEIVRDPGQRRRSSSAHQGKRGSEDAAGIASMNRVSSVGGSGRRQVSSRQTSRRSDRGPGDEDDEDEETPFLANDDQDEERDANDADLAMSSDEKDEAKGKGGTILGIHNLFIVLPQFVVAIVSSIILSSFNHSDSENGGPAGSADRGAEDGSAPGVAWVLRFGGGAMLVAAACTRLVPLTESERIVSEGRVDRLPLNNDQVDEDTPESS